MDLLNELNRCVPTYNYTPIDFSDEEQCVEAIDTFADYYKYDDYAKTLEEINALKLTDQIPLEILDELYENIKTSTNRENFDIVGNAECIRTCVSIILNMLYTSNFDKALNRTKTNNNEIPIEHVITYCKYSYYMEYGLSRVIFYIQFVASVLIYAEECNNLVLK